MLAVGLVGGVVDLAAADREHELDRRKASVTRGIDRQQADVEQASRQLQSATGALRASQQQLSAARGGLARTLGQLAAARQLDAQMEQGLAAAEQRLAVADGDYAQARVLVADTQQGIERFAVQSMASSTPTLISVDAMASGDSPLAFPELMSSAESVLSAQTSSMDDLEAAQVLMKLREERVEELRDEVEVERAVAAEHLGRTAALVREARAQRQQVSALVVQRRDSRREAASVRERDLRILRHMRRERARVRVLLSKVRMHKAVTVKAQPSAGGGPASSSSTGNGFLALPVPGAYVSSPYGMRMHPIFRVMKLHDGIDFAAACGTPVLAAADGRVVSQYYDTGFGNRVIVANGSVNGTPLATSYNHLTRYSTSTGENVSRGEVIGYVGTTGFSTGCHLHFMVYASGRPTDPAGWL